MTVLSVSVLVLVLMALWAALSRRGLLIHGLVVLAFLVDEAHRAGLSAEDGAEGLPGWMTLGHETWVRAPLPLSPLAASLLLYAIVQLVIGGIQPRLDRVEARVLAGLGLVVIGELASGVYNGQSPRALLPAVVPWLLVAALFLLCRTAATPRLTNTLSVVTVGSLFAVKLLMAEYVRRYSAEKGLQGSLIPYFDSATPFLAGVLAITLGYAALPSSPLPRTAPRWLLGLVAAEGFLLVLTSGRRTAIAVTLALCCLAPLLTASRARRLMSALLVAAVLALGFIGSSTVWSSGQRSVSTAIGENADESAIGHWDDLRTGWNVAVRHPVSGYGASAAQDTALTNLTSTTIYVHNDALLAWIRGGAIALTGLLIFVICASSMVIRTLRLSRAPAVLAGGLAVLGILLAGVFLPALNGSQRWPLIAGVALGLCSPLRVANAVSHQSPEPLDRLR